MKQGKSHFLSIAIIVLYGAMFWACAKTYTPPAPQAPKLVTFDAAPGTTGNASSLIRVTSDAVPEFYPMISKDGKKMVFHIRDDSKYGNERFSIMMINLGQPGRVPLVSSYTGQPSFFPDNQTIIYSYMKPAKPVLAKSKIDGASGISYTSPNNMGDFDNSPMVSPDGKKIAFDTKFGESFQVCTVEISGMGQTILTEGFNPYWSPNGVKLVYNKMVGKYTQVFEYDFKTGQSTQLTNGDFNNSNPKYSFDGKYIVLSSDRDNQNEHIFVMKEDGSNLVQLTQGKSRNGMPCFAPDNTIFFCSNAGSKGVANQWNAADIWSLKPVL